MLQVYLDPTQKHEEGYRKVLWQLLLWKPDGYFLHFYHGFFFLLY